MWKLDIIITLAVICCRPYEWHRNHMDGSGGFLLTLDKKGTEIFIQSSSYNKRSSMRGPMCDKVWQISAKAILHNTLWAAKGKGIYLLSWRIHFRLHKRRIFFHPKLCNVSKNEFSHEFYLATLLLLLSLWRKNISASSVNILEKACIGMS